MTPRLRACPCCGLVMQLPGERPPGSRLECPRCERSVDVTGNDHHRSRTLALALAAALLYPAAILLPVLTIEQFGQRHSASIWDGACKLLAQGELLVGGAILGFSIVLPALKLAGLVALSMPRFLKHRHQARTYHLVELTGRFGMLDVLLVALLVAVLKLGDMVTVLPGPGAATFTITVVLSLLASASFDPHAIWEES